MTEKNTAILKTELKVFWNRLKAGILNFSTPLSIPFRQNPFMLWVHPYPEWSRRFFVSDNYYTMKPGYHTGGTTQFLPCVFATYSRRWKWLAAVAFLIFMGTSTAILQLNPHLLPKLSFAYLPLFFLIIILVFPQKSLKDAFYHGLLGLISGGISIFASKNLPPHYAFWPFAVALLFPPLMFAHRVKSPVIWLFPPLTGLLFVTHSLREVGPYNLVYMTAAIFSVAFCCAIDNKKETLIKTPIIIHAIFSFIILPGLSILFLRPQQMLYNTIWFIFIASFYPAWAIVNIDTMSRRLKIVFIILYTLLNTQIITQNFVEHIQNTNLNFYTWLLLSLITCVIIVPALPAKKTHICNESKADKCIGRLASEGQSNKRLILEYSILLLFISILIGVFAIKIIAYSSSYYANGALLHLNTTIKDLLASILAFHGVTDWTLLFQIKKRNEMTTDSPYKPTNPIRLSSLGVSLLGAASLKFPNTYTYSLLALSLLTLISLIAKELYISPNKKTRKPTNYVWSLVTFNCGLMIFLNMEPPCQHILFIYIGVFSFLLALLFFYFPKYFHTKKRHECTSKLEYGIYLWPLGLRAWSLLFGITLSAPLSLFGWIPAMSMILFVTFLIPWFIYSMLRTPTLLDLWRGKIFYQRFIEGEESLTPTTSGIVRFWPFRCLPFLPTFTNYRGGQSIRSSLYTRIALHQIITSQIPIRPRLTKEGDNYSFFLSLKWFWFCCVPIWSSFIVLLTITIAHSSLTGEFYFTQHLATVSNPLFYRIGEHRLLSRYVFLFTGVLWLILSYKMISIELSRLSSLSAYEQNQEGQAIVPLWVKAQAVIAARDFSEIYKTQTQKIIKLTLGAFASIYCVILTFG
ncbi:hypothetical protein [Maridesulfovibrio sp.]